MDFEIPEKVLQYEIFVNDVLKEDLKYVHEQQNKVTTELAEFIQLKNSIQTFKDASLIEDGLKTKIDLGCNFYVQANICDTKTILIDIGLKNYLEFTLDEALQFIEKRCSLLTQQLNKLRKDSAHVKGMIKMTLGGLQQLQS